MTKKVEVNLAFFSGFYESIHTWNFDREEEYAMENYPESDWDDFDWKNDEIGYCKSYVRAVAKEIGFEMEFVEMTSPREYNFTTDKIYVSMKVKDIKEIAKVALDSEEMKKLVKARFTSRDGFASFYSNDIKEWKEKKVEDWDYNELGTLLDAYIEIKEIDDLDETGYEYCSENGQWVDYKVKDSYEEKLEELKQEKKKKEEWNELHEEELEKLEKWKKSVLG